MGKGRRVCRVASALLLQIAVALRHRIGWVVADLGISELRFARLMSQIPSIRLATGVVSVLLFLGCESPDVSRDLLAADRGSVDRGRYLVEGVGVCWTCHTPRTERAEPDRARWLLGAPVVFESTMPAPNWAQVAPRLAGVPPGTDEQFVTLMMTGISRTGLPPRPPMPRFAMTRMDAESVLAYLKSLKATR